LEERDNAGDHGDFVAQAPSNEPCAESVTTHPRIIPKSGSRNMGLSRDLSPSCGLLCAERRASMH
jgi:hypothetical protein